MSILNGATVSINTTASEPMAEVEQTLTPTMAHRYLGLNPVNLTKKESEMVSAIQDFLNEHSPKIGEQALKLKKIMFKLGTPRFANSRLEQIYEYVKLNKALSETKDMMKAMER